MDILIQQELVIYLEDKLAEMLDKKWEKIDRQACDTICLCLYKDQKYLDNEKDILLQKMWLRICL